MKILIVLILVTVSFQYQVVYSQSSRFKDEVAQLTAKAPQSNKDVILFTGSSTIKMWTEINGYFPNYNVVNRGFGGSQMTDLLYYFDQLALPLKPSKIFIYEGDNDLSAGKPQELILATADSVLTRIRTKLAPETQVYFISAKPSVSRWNLKEKYVAYNDALKRWCVKNKGVTYVDVWTIALDDKGQVRNDIFLPDNLHMNKKGYDLWGKALLPYLRP